MLSVDMITSEQFYGLHSPAGLLRDYTPQLSHLYQVPIIKSVPVSLKNAARSCLRDQREKCKKKVIFADDRGFELEQVKVMEESIHIPSLLTINSPPVERNYVDSWELCFQLPSVDYAEFRRRINEDCVCLESVLVKQNEGSLKGTVKVKNIDFYKEIFVRTSSDGWLSYEDNYCSFLESGPQCVYDTFSFRLQLPVNSRRLDFCICFLCKGREFWDSNNGKNYVVERSSVRLISQRISCVRLNYGNSWCKNDDNCGTNPVPYW